MHSTHSDLLQAVFTHRLKVTVHFKWIPAELFCPENESCHNITINALLLQSGVTNSTRSIFNISTFCTANKARHRGAKPSSSHGLKNSTEMFLFFEKNENKNMFLLLF